MRERVKDGARSIALVAETQKDLEEVMVARLVAIHPPNEAPTVRYRPVRLTWPNGAMALGYNGTEPDQLRGPEFDTAWVDELAKYRYARETWDMLQFTMRRGDPRVFVTTTPRPIPVIKEILADPSTVVTRGSTFDNAENLPAKFIAQLRDKYEGTRLGRQELNAEVLDDVPDALWNRGQLEGLRVSRPPQDLDRIVVAVDPPTTSGENADECGIVVAGCRGKDWRTREAFVLADASSQGEKPNKWAWRVINTAKLYGADAIIVETNQGGEMVMETISALDRSIPIKGVHASKGKYTRAEPVAAWYEQGKVHHVGHLAKLEDQMVEFTIDFDAGKAGYSPDRLDALVYGITDLLTPPGRAGSRSQ